MRSGTSWLSSCKRPAVTSPPSQSSSHSVGSFRTSNGSQSGWRLPRHSRRWFLGDTAWGGVLRCTGIQPLCSVVPVKAATPSISHAWAGEAACLRGTGAANRTRHAYAIGIHLHRRCRPRSYPVPEATRKPARRQTSDGLQPSYGLAKMSSLVRPSKLINLRSSILCLRGARARVKQNFLLQPAVALAEGGMCWHFWLRTDQDQPSKYFFLHTDMHSPLDSIPHTFGRMHAPVHRRTCYPAHMHTHTFPRPVDSSAILLLLFMSISSCCYFYVFSSVCNKSFGFWMTGLRGHGVPHHLCGIPMTTRGSTSRKRSLRRGLSCILAT